MAVQLKAFLKDRILNPVGALVGAPKVQLSSPLIRGGNFLYYWMWAFKNDASSRPARVLYQDSIDDWLNEFPLADRLTVRKAEVPRLLSTWVNSHWHTYGQDFSVEDLEQFGHALVDSSPSFQSRLAQAAEFLGGDSCVINVRRGDYYMYPHLTEMYGLDIVGYVEDALERLNHSGAEPSRYVFVSDDVEWCLEHLEPLVGDKGVTYPGRKSMFDDLAILASAKNVMLSNSTFAFWGAYLALSVAPGQVVFAPPYHFRDEQGNPVRDPYLPTWHVC